MRADYAASAAVKDAASLRIEFPQYAIRDGARFREMLLRRDEEKLERLNAIVQDQGQAAPVKILMDVAAELDGRAENYDGMDAAAKRKASREMKKLIGKVDEMRSAIGSNTAEIESRIDAVGGKIDEVGGKVEAVGKKVDRIRAGRRRKASTRMPNGRFALLAGMRQGGMWSLGIQRTES